MSQRYRVVTPTGIDLGGRLIPSGQQFSPGDYRDWCDAAVKSGALERIEPAAKEVKKK